MSGRHASETTAKRRRDCYHGAVTLSRPSQSFLGLALILSSLVPSAASATAGLFLVVQKTSNTIVLQSDSGHVYMVDSEMCPIAVGDSVAVDTNLDGGPQVSGKLTKGERYFNTNCAIWNSRSINQRLYVVKALSNDEQILATFAGQTALVTYGPGCGLSIKNYERQDLYLAMGNDKFDGINDTIIIPNGNTCDATEVTFIDGRSITANNCPAHSSRHPTDKHLCVCEVGFAPDADAISCVGTPLICPTHSTLVSGICQCDAGYISKQNRCMTEQAACQLEHGPYADGNHSQCWCQPGYNFGNNNQCVRSSRLTPSSSTLTPSVTRVRRVKCPYGMVRDAATNTCFLRGSRE